MFHFPCIVFVSKYAIPTERYMKWCLQTCKTRISNQKFWSQPHYSKQRMWIKLRRKKKNVSHTCSVPGFCFLFLFQNKPKLGRSSDGKQIFCGDGFNWQLSWNLSQIILELHLIFRCQIKPELELGTASIRGNSHFCKQQTWRFTKILRSSSR